MMERGCHVNIAMTDDVGTNGAAGSKVVAAADQKQQQQRGSTVSFHSIQYKVPQRSGFLCKRKSGHRGILFDLKSVV